MTKKKTLKKTTTLLDQESVRNSLVFRARCIYGRGEALKEDSGLIPGYIKRNQPLLLDLINYFATYEDTE